MPILTIIRFVAFVLCGVAALSSQAQEALATRLSAQASDPNELGWMVGFPPPKSKRITQPDSNFFSFPKLRWSVCHMRELLPTAAIKRNVSSYEPLQFQPIAGIDEVVFTPLHSDKTMTWSQSLAANYTDGIVIMHRGKVVYERYFGCLDKYSNHAAMSMTKSVTGLIAEMLIAKGQLDPAAKVATLIPELKNSAFAAASVRQVMDMTTALDYSEKYGDPKADIWRYAYAANPLPKPADYQGPVGYFEYLQTIQGNGEHGKAFGYKTVNTDVLGWIVSVVSNTKFDQLVSELLWQPLGMQQDADITVDGIGTPFAGGGLSASLRDLARLGQAVLDNGRINGKQVIPQAAIESIRLGGNKQAFAKAGFKTMANGSYRSMWWHFHNQNQAFAARGVHGQTIYIDPAAEMVIVRLASHPSASNSKIDPTSLPAYQAIADFLSAKK
ncbi:MULTISPECIES: serine hydrolase domain-containing protein [unclassified Pseudoalteromonas]|uniref:serine hydrolase domain-containing protein n=1 Tax=unclassified Pseudoalteromonas TaxID=194690 RepID=UPI0030154FC7